MATSLVVTALIISLSLPVPGVAEEVVQPTLPVNRPGAEIFFRDSFMREKADNGDWTHVSGEWSLDEAAIPGVSANPFSLRGKSPMDALAVTGEFWWRSYAFKASLRTPPVYSRFGVVAAYRDPGEYLFFGFSEKEGMILELATGGKRYILSKTPSFPVPYQWYSFALAFKGKMAWCVVDERMVIEAAMPIEICGKAGIMVRGAADFGVTVDDCAASGLPEDPAQAAASAKDGLQSLFSEDRLIRRRFPTYFTDDKLMRQWASSEADWLAYIPPPNAWNQSTEATWYSYALPIFNDASFAFEFASKVQKTRLIVLPYRDDGPAKALIDLTIAARDTTFEVTLSDSAGTSIGAFPNFPFCKLMRVYADGDTVTLRHEFAPPTVLKIPGLGDLLKDGARMVISEDGYAMASSGGLNLCSGSLIDETFNDAPSSWMTVYGNWDIGVRWACSPQYTYLTSSDRMTSQLYSKHLFGGKIYCDAYLSEKMITYRWPSYYDLQWFSLSIPDSAGDFSKGVTGAAAYPTPEELSLFVNGRRTANAKVEEKMDPWSLHNAWLKLRMECGPRETNFRMNLLGGVQGKVYTLTAPGVADGKLRPLAIWNSRSGITVPRCRISAQIIKRGGLEKAFTPLMPAPCGVTADLSARAPDPATFIAPRFDFAKGSAGWSVPANQPALCATPLMDGATRIGVEVSAPFCGSRLAFVSPKLSIDARVSQLLRVRFKTDVGAGLALYIRSGLKSFRVPLKGNPSTSPNDGCIPVSSRLFSSSTDGKFLVVTVKLVELFEEYLCGESDPIIDGLSLERLEPPTPDSLGIEQKDVRTLQLGSIEFLSTFASSVVKDVPPPRAPFDADVAGLAEFWAGLQAREIKLPADKVKSLSAGWESFSPAESDGGLSLTFRKGFQSLSPVGASDETLLWREKIENEFHLTAYKSGLEGYLGMKLLPFPVSALKYPAMTIKYRGDLNPYFLLVKSEWWFLIPLNRAEVVKIPKGNQLFKPPVPAKAYHMAPMRIESGDTNCLLFYFPTFPELVNRNMIEEMYIVSGYEQTVPEGSSFAISSIAFYDPAKTRTFCDNVAKSQCEIVFQPTRPEIAVRDARVDGISTYIISESGKPVDTKPKSVTLLSCDDQAAVFEFDTPVPLSDVAFKIGDRTYSGNLVKQGETPQKFSVLRSGIYNDAPGSAKWTALVMGGKSYKTIGEGELALSSANPLRLERVCILPDDSLMYDNYEKGIGSATSRRSPGLLAAANPFTGSYALEFPNLSTNHFFSTILYPETFNAARYPYISFDYRMWGSNLSLMFQVEGHFKDVKFTPINIPLTLYKDRYYYIGVWGGMTMGVFGEIPDVKGDAQWHSVSFNILDVVKGEPANGKYSVQGIALRECNVNPVGAWAQVDNFRIYGGAKRSFSVRVEPPAGLAGTPSYEWCLVNSGGKPVTKTTVTADQNIRITPPDTGKLQFSIRLLLDGKPIGAEKIIPLLFTAAGK
ncbi:MAG: hypothetical protein WC712_09185 [Candidatus Brocadiia bacterium]